jgi:glycosyltransferase 2 family protein
VWVIMNLLGIEISLLAATLIEAFSTAIRFATFMVPASVGVLEGGHVAIFTALGLGASAGMSFSIVRRIREATWIGLGFLALTAYRGLTPAAASVAPDG